MNRINMKESLKMLRKKEVFQAFYEFFVISPQVGGNDWKNKKFYDRM